MLIRITGRAEVTLDDGGPVTSSSIIMHGPKGPDANPDNGDCAPLYLANLRKKTELAAVLKEFGAAE